MFEFLVVGAAACALLPVAFGLYYIVVFGCLPRHSRPQEPTYPRPVHRYDDRRPSQSYGGISAESPIPPHDKHRPLQSHERPPSQPPVPQQDERRPSYGGISAQPPVPRHDKHRSSRSYESPPSQPPVSQQDERRPLQSYAGPSSQPPVLQRDERRPPQSYAKIVSQPLVPKHDERRSLQPYERIPSQPTAAKRDERRPLQSYERQPSRPPVPRHDESQYQRDVYAFQRDNSDTPAVETHASLRDRAKKEGDLMSQCRQHSQEAYKRGDRRLAKALSDQATRHALKMDQLNAQASALIFKENNQNKSPCNVDLHGLYVKEAIDYSERAIEEALRRGDSKIYLIVGRGTHSDGGVARLKPAIQEEMQIRGFRIGVDPRNPGVLVVRLDDKKSVRDV